jgi:hypothetical protein
MPKSSNDIHRIVTGGRTGIGAAIARLFLVNNAGSTSNAGPLHEMTNKT